MSQTLKDRIKAQIRIDGPLPVSLYMQLALHDRQHGYYATRPGLMKDFATAPEISQVFGELIGLWAVNEWRAMGSPARFDLIEIGPGRGVLMTDALRAASADPDFMAALTLRLIEPSPALQTVQAERLGAYDPQFYTGLDQVPANDAIIIANEWLDCLPIRQFVTSPEGWRERVVGLGEDEALVFGLSPVMDTLPEPAPSGAEEWEYSPALEAAADDIARRFTQHKGRALLIDYGPDAITPADTLRAYQNGAQVSPLDHPGEVDMTADVDFAALSRYASARGLDVSGPLPQGLFLKSLGLESRVSTLMAANPADAARIGEAAMRIASPDEMGLRFKAICLSSGNLGLPAGF